MQIRWVGWSLGDPWMALRTLDAMLQAPQMETLRLTNSTWFKPTTGWTRSSMHRMRSINRALA
jgi:hypothetical protein